MKHGDDQQCKQCKARFRRGHEGLQELVNLKGGQNEIVVGVIFAEDGRNLPCLLASEAVVLSLEPSSLCLGQGEVDPQVVQ